MIGFDPMFLASAAGAAASVRAIRRLGLLESLGEGPLTIEELAGRCGTEPRATAMLLDAVRTLGLVEHDGERYRVAPASSLVVASFQIFEGLEDRLRRGVVPAPFDTPDGAGTRYPDAVAHLAASVTRPAADVARLVAEPGLEIIDIGAGGAPWSLAIVRRASGCRVTAVDRPAVLEVTRTAVREAGHAATYRFLAADITADDFGCEAYDLALLGNVCHLFGEEVNRALLARTFRALRPGGRLAILEPQVRDDDERSLAMYALSLLVRTAHGEVHPLGAYEDWIRSAGFCGVRTRPVSGPMSIALIEAERPP